MLKIKLPLSNIKEFTELSSKINRGTNTDHLPTAEYIKVEIVFDECIFTKNTIESFLEYKFDVSMFNIEDCKFLLNEKIVNDFIKSISSKENILYISIEDLKNETNGDISKNIKISNTEKMKDSKKFNYNTSLIRIENFPVTSYELNSKKTRIDESIIQSIEIASNFISKDNIKANFLCVYLGSFEEMKMVVGNDCFCADGHSLFYQKTFPSINFEPIAILSKEINILSGLKYCDYSVIGNHNIYFLPNKNIVFGFRHIDNTSAFDYKRFKNSFWKNENSITLNIEDILTFCLRAKSSSEHSNNFVNSICYIKDDIATFEYNNEESNLQDIKETPIIYKRGEIKQFVINHTQFYDTLKKLPYNEIDISEEEFFISISTKEDKNYFGYFAKLHKA